jgi:ribosomal protein S18 acetylase RimI-like enzyme
MRGFAITGTVDGELARPGPVRGHSGDHFGASRGSNSAKNITGMAMTVNLEYKIAKADDLETVLAVLRDAALWLEAKEVDQWQNYIKPADDLREWIEQGISGREVFLVYRNQKAIATFRLQWADLMFWPDKNDNVSGYIHSFAVVTEFRGQGVGDLILQWIESECLKRYKKFLRLDCNSKNAGLQKYYLDRGFKVVETREAQGYLNVFFEKDLI